MQLSAIRSLADCWSSFSFIGATVKQVRAFFSGVLSVYGFAQNMTCVSCTRHAIYAKAAGFSTMSPYMTLLSIPRAAGHGMPWMFVHAYPLAKLVSRCVGRIFRQYLVHRFRRTGMHGQGRSDVSPLLARSYLRNLKLRHVVKLSFQRCQPWKTLSTFMHSAEYSYVPPSVPPNLSITNHLSGGPHDRSSPDTSFDALNLNRLFLWAPYARS